MSSVTGTNKPEHKPAAKWKQVGTNLHLHYLGASLKISWMESLGGYLGYMNDELIFPRASNGLSARNSLALKLQELVDNRLAIDNRPASVVKPKKYNMRWINRLIHELLMSKSTHNFTFSRNEVMELMDMSGTKPVIAYVHSDGRLLRPEDIKPGDIKHVKPLVIPTSYIIDQIKEGKL